MLQPLCFGMQNAYRQLGGGQRRDVLVGQPLYDGIEYDPEVPNHVVIASPGGVSGIQHHWTHGMYSPSSNYHDIWGASQDPYIDGVYGNMYQPGNSAYVNQVDDQYYQGPGVPSYSAAEADVVTNVLTGKKEQTSPKLFEVLADEKKSKEGFAFPSVDKPLSSRPWALIVLFVFGSLAAYLALNSWERFGYQVLHHTRETSWVRVGIYALIAVVVYAYVFWKLA